MRSPAALLGLAALTLVVALAAMLVRDGPEPAPGEGPAPGEPLLPALAARVNEVAAVASVHAGTRVAVERRDGRWVVTTRDGYPADAARVRDLILGLARLERLEPKSAREARWPQMGLGDPAAADARATEVTLRADDGAEIARVVIGDRRAAKGSAAEQELFVRRGDESRAWLAEGRLPVLRSVDAWLESEVLALDAARIRDVTVVHADGGRLRVERTGPGAQDFALSPLPPEREVTSPYRVASVATAFAALDLEDVRPAAGVDFDAAREFRAELTTDDGLRVTLDVARSGDRRLARLHAATVPAPAPGEAAAAPTAGSAAGSASAPVAGARGEAERLNARWAGWAYRLPGWKLDTIGQRVESLTGPPEAGDGAGSGSTGDPATEG